jgi:K+-transporting ATPase ATPase C chain
MLTDLRRAAIALAVFTVLVGLAYPLLLVGIGQAAFGHRADGSLVRAGGRVVGSSLIGQAFDAPRYFWGRPSAAGDGYDAGASGASNLGPTSRALADVVQGGSTPCSPPTRARASPTSRPSWSPPPAPARPGHLPGGGAVPDRAGGRGPGLDPALLRDLVRRHTQGRSLGFLGEPRVNMLQLNLALDTLSDR